MIHLNFTDPGLNTYYYPLILFLIVILFILQFVNVFLKNSESDPNASMNNTLQPGLSYSMTFITKKNNLKIRYLTGYILTRAAMWSKAPYLYTLYSTYHGFTMSEIGVLYIIDAVAALVAGPITGGLADKYGRRLFCQFYNFLVILNLGLRMTGNKPLAYTAQVLTGIGGGLINTVFESWIVFEARKDFGIREIERDRFLKKLFKTQTVFDAMMSIIISAICAVTYSYYGLFAPLFISIAFSLFGMIATQFMWDENKPNSQSTVNMGQSFMDALGELKKRDVLCIGISESLFQAVLNIYLFAWTPLLQASTTTGINVGFIFTCFVITLILGTTIFEMVIIHLKCKPYNAIALALLTEFCIFIAVYYIDSFMVRCLLLSCVNGISGFYNPLNSIIKSKILVEKYRALLMSIFRIPLNAYVIIVLFFIKYMDPFDICLIAAGMIFIAFLVSLILIFWRTEKPVEETK